MQSREYLCQYANQSGAVSESRFRLNVVPALQTINGAEATEARVLSGSDCQLCLIIPDYNNPDDIVWHDGTHGAIFDITDVRETTTVQATVRDVTYTFTIIVSTSDFTYYSLMTSERGYRLVSSVEELQQLSDDNYFVLASDEADLLIGLDKGMQNGNQALFVCSADDPYDEHPTEHTLSFHADGWRISATGGDGPVKVNVGADGTYSIAIRSNQGILIEAEAL